MTDPPATPLLDEINRLNAWHLLDEIERLAAQAQSELAALRAMARARELEQRVTAYLAANPDATANAVYRAVRGPRQDVLRLVRAARHRCKTPVHHPNGASA